MKLLKGKYYVTQNKLCVMRCVDVRPHDNTALMIFATPISFEKAREEFVRAAKHEMMNDSSPFFAAHTMFAYYADTGEFKDDKYVHPLNIYPLTFSTGMNIWDRSHDAIELTTYEQAIGLIEKIGG